DGVITMPVPATSPRPPASVALMSTTACSTCASDAVPELCDPDDPLPELCDPGVPGAVDAVDVAPWALPRATTVTPVAAAMATVATPLTTAVRNGRRRRDAGVHAYCGGQGGGPKPAPAGGIGVAAAATASPCDAGCVESWTALEPPLEDACEVFVTANAPAPAAAASPAAATAVATHRAR